MELRVGGHLGGTGEIWAEGVGVGLGGHAILARDGGGGVPEVEVILVGGGAAVLLLEELQAGRRVTGLGGEVRRLARPDLIRWPWGGGGDKTSKIKRFGEGSPFPNACVRDTHTERLKRIARDGHPAFPQRKENE